MIPPSSAAAVLDEMETFRQTHDDVGVDRRRKLLDLERDTARLVETVCGWLAAIWFAHVGLDRMFGHGLKYEAAFKDTHLQRA